MTTQRGWITNGACIAAALVVGTGCASDSADVSAHELANRAYIVSRESDELTVIDLDKLEVIAQVKTAGISNHMAELNADFTKVYIDSSDTDESVVVDAKALEVIKRIQTGKHPTHLSLSRDGSLLAVMDEEEGTGAITFIDTEQDVERKRLPGFFTPHFMRFSADGAYGYVANLGAHHLTRVDLASLEIESHIPLDGYQGPPNQTLAPDEGGFADAQIDSAGVLYAAHTATNRVLVYDTAARKKLPELLVGVKPWIVFAEHPFAGLPLHHIVPNLGDRTISLIKGDSIASVAATLPGDEEAYGVNFSSLTPDKAFVMNRVREDVAIVDTATNQITGRIPVGGNTETAATTADGKWIIAAVSSANRVVVIDAVTNEIVKTFDNVGRYPWSVTVPGGQNYCH
jgi:DNA-binding beta-propeller fold protein YncE